MSLLTSGSKVRMVKEVKVPGVPMWTIVGEEYEVQEIDVRIDLLGKYIEEGGDILSRKFTFWNLDELEQAVRSANSSKSIKERKKFRWETN